MSWLRSIAFLSLVCAAGGALSGCYDRVYTERPICPRAYWVPPHRGYWGRWHPGHWRCG